MKYKNIVWIFALLLVIPLSSALTVVNDSAVFTPNLNNIFLVMPNNFTDIQAKIDQVGTSGGTVMIPCGTYSVTTTVYIKNNYTQVIGAGSCTILNVTGVGTTFNTNINISNIRLSNLFINQNNITPTFYTVRFDNGTLNDIEVDHVQIKDNPGYSIRFYGDDISVHDNYLNNVLHGVSIIGKQNGLRSARIVNNRFININMNTTDTGEYGEGIDFNDHNGTGHAIITNNEIIGFREEGIDANVNLGTVSDNYIEMNPGEGRTNNGITFSQTGETGGSVSNNIIVQIGPNGRGVQLRKSKGVSISSNYFLGAGNGSKGILLNDLSSDGNLVSNVMVSNNYFTNLTNATYSTLKSFKQAMYVNNEYSNNTANYGFATSDVVIRWERDDMDLKNNNVSNVGYFGLHTDIPNALMEIVNDLNNNATLVLRKDSTSAGQNVTLGFHISTSWTEPGFAGLRISRMLTPTSGDHQITFYNRKNGTVSDSLRINTEGSLQVLANTTAATCTAANAGAIYYSAALFKHFGCNSTTWNALY